MPVKDFNQNISDEEVIQLLGKYSGPERIIEYLLRNGPYGDHFKERKDTLSLEKLISNPQGVDKGSLRRRIPEILRTPNDEIHMAPQMILSDIKRLEEHVNGYNFSNKQDEFILIGRRNIHSNNSWYHNFANLHKGDNNCDLIMHPDDARKNDIEAGDIVEIISEISVVQAPVRISDEIMVGVLSLPHGWGHEKAEHLEVARKFAGVNCNELANAGKYDPLSGNAALNEITVKIRRRLPGRETK